MPGSEEIQNNGPENKPAEGQTTAVDTSAAAAPNNGATAAETGATTATEAIVPVDGGDASVSPKTRAFLDSLGEPTSEKLAVPGAAKPADAKLGPDGKPVAEPLAEAQVKPADAKPNAAVPGAQVDPNKPAPSEIDKEEAEVLAEIKSTRGQERIKKVFNTLREKEKVLVERETDLREFREMVTSTGVSAQDFAQQLEFGRLVNSGKPEDLRVALQMADQIRLDLAQQLGIEVPGFDPLTEHPDLVKAVENMETTRAHALEVASARNIKKQQEQQRRQSQEQQQSQTQFTALVQQAGTTMETYLQSRAHEVDHPMRLEALVTHFKDPAKLQEFVQTYQPNQWLATIKYMYDNAQPVRQQAAAPAHSSQQQPLRSRTASHGKPALAGEKPVERLASFIDSL